ncbi:MAG: aminoglycoside phosphotransferase family protein [Candidatus Falkowbacteria bacterium]
MNIILDLLDLDKVAKIFNKKILSQYTGVKKISLIEIVPHKKQIWHTTYHVVFQYEVIFDFGSHSESKSLYCSAHSSEPRHLSFAANTYLWQCGLGRGQYHVARPLYYSKKYNGYFYEGVPGQSLYELVKNGERAKVLEAIVLTARWLAKLHQLKKPGLKNFNPMNSRLATVVPGSQCVIREITDRCPQYAPLFKQFYKIFIDKEASYLKTRPMLSLIHGDAHPDNVIVGDKGVAFIDFADICIADFARDLGCFSQQLDYMIGRKINDVIFADKCKKKFINEYCRARRIKISAPIEERIKTYYYWTAIRTANYFLMKDDPQPERAKPLIEEVKKALGL